MTTKRTNVLAGTLIGGILLLATAGLVLAQDPTSTPTPSSMAGTCSAMGGQGMMGGQGLMGGQVSEMNAMHEAMGEGGTYSPELMQSMHEQYHSNP